MKIVQVASELFPYVKTGGLADAVGSLASTLADAGHEVSVFVPGYRAAFENRDVAGSTHKVQLKIEMGDAFYTGDVRVFSPRPNLTVYLVCRDEFFDRRGLYGNGERDFEDNYHRFIFFSKAVTEALRLLEIKADVVHCHDWQAALLPVLLRFAERRHSVTLAIKTVFTIHNIAFQGIFPIRSFYLANLPDDLLGIDGLEYYGQISLLKAGILFSDRVTTVSPRYAKEIQTAEFGCGLEGVVGTRADDVVGLINGIDSKVWNPATDALLPATYRADNLAGKATCRAALLKQHGMDPSFKGPVFGMICRFADQKGIDLLLANKDFFHGGHCRLFVLGSGERRYEEAVQDMAAASPSHISLSMRLDESMSHLIEAGCDFFLMPSHFEPCGLNQMYSQAYGTVPLASRVGGLCDTVVDIDDDPAGGTGIMFPPTAAGLRSGLDRALKLFADSTRMAAVRQRGMRRDFSWATAAKAYEQLYQDSM